MKRDVKALLTKEKFIYYINELKEYKRKIENISEVMRANCPDAIYWPPSLEHIVLDMLKELFSDEYATIEYFVYELEFGEKWIPGMVISAGKDVKLESAEDLYNYLVQIH